jgi:hypothetical protein
MSNIFILSHYLPSATKRSESAVFTAYTAFPVADRFKDMVAKPYPDKKIATEFLL